MITAVMKKYVNGRWVEFDVTELYSIGQIIQSTHINGEEYKVIDINRSRVTLEKVVDEEVVEGE